MDIIGIYYDNSSEDEFIKLLPIIEVEFKDCLKRFYDKNSKYKLLTPDSKKIEEEIIERSSLKLLNINCSIKYLTSNPHFEYLWLGIYLYSSDKSLFMIPDGVKSFDSSMVSHEKIRFKVFQIEFFEKIILATNPSHINNSDEQFEQLSCDYEYVKDPYWLALELVRVNGKHKYEYVIDKNDGQWELLKKIKQVITVEEIVEICYKYAKHDDGYYIKYYPETGGIAWFGGKDIIMYPRYFIREELRRRGVNIPHGRSERHMKMFGEPWRKK